MAWFLGVVILVVVLSVIGSQGDKVKKAIESQAAQVAQEKLLRERCEAYRDYLRRSQAGGPFGAMGATELYVHVQTAAMKMLQGRKSLKGSNEGIVTLGVIVVIVAFFIGVGNDNVGIVVPAIIASIVGGVALSQHLEKEMLADDQQIAMQFGLEVDRLRTTIDGLMDVGG